MRTQTCKVSGHCSHDSFHCVHVPTFSVETGWWWQDVLEPPQQQLSATFGAWILLHMSKARTAMQSNLWFTCNPQTKEEGARKRSRNRNPVLEFKKGPVFPLPNLLWL